MNQESVYKLCFDYPYEAVVENNLLSLLDIPFTQKDRSTLSVTITFQDIRISGKNKIERNEHKQD